MSDVLESAREQLLFGISDNLAELLVDSQPAAVRSDVRDAHRRLAECRAETFLAFAYGLLGAPAFKFRRRAAGADLQYRLGDPGFLKGFGIHDRQQAQGPA